ncbi:Gfo/Idh/MocA family protein [Paenibacillus macquariensis]|uniref:Predicted dehydrogenase n=1 Tax=Paenibacillus macquariensis TaxID=948756 RepID=A0ABY1KGK5_9BACL|nr:Gfo/Idh/MocA family oxidoreductase [Paenibacillus macquariensis]MEC0093921.1 Gfo/Idh/MocA family oxidoreductase [Paenibacillus macquariensis]OAB34291.1 oxidoreductase [Paenibacillus macquariensis subsp. macquariensis]SIR68125.1 Predicted dehydrogenase [Paenibacillus macquariensis]
METVKIGIIGVGQIGKMHIEQYQSIPGAEIIAVCDVNEVEAKRVAEKFNIPHVYTDYRSLLEREDIVAVDVCLHNNFHAPVTVAALHAGKNVYCEKPIAGTYFDGQEMVAAAKETGKLLHIQLGTLFTKETKAAKTLIDGGMLGKLYHARSTGFRRRGRPFVDGYGTPYFTRKETAGGGALLDMGVYHIAQLLYLLGNPNVERISGKLYQELDMLEDRREQSRFDVEELASGLIRFNDGLTLDIIESWAVHLGGFEGSSIAGSKGGIRMPNGQEGAQAQSFSFHNTVCDMDMDSTIDLEMMDTRWHRIRENEDAYDSSQDHWIAALQGRVPLLPTSQIALNTMLISEGMYLSDKLGREVTAAEVIALSHTTAVPL